jgi:threonine dehydrogenase-like Zn-dependent dehydrogenase
MIPTKAYAVHNATGDPTPWSFEHRDPGPHEILIDIHFCGICHTDIHKARNEWGNARLPDGSRSRDRGDCREGGQIGPEVQGRGQGGGRVHGGLLPSFLGRQARNSIATTSPRCGQREG